MGRQEMAEEEREVALQQGEEEEEEGEEEEEEEEDEMADREAPDRHAEEEEEAGDEETGSKGHDDDEAQDDEEEEEEEEDMAPLEQARQQEQEDVEEEEEDEEDDGDNDDADDEGEDEGLREGEARKQQQQQEGDKAIDSSRHPHADGEKDPSHRAPESALPSSRPKPDKSGFVEVDLSEIRKDVQCPICLGIIRKTRTVMECLHRFCRECIDKSMRLGNNECPVCRTHCASRRSLRDDLNFDALISALYPNVDTYEEEEFTLHEENELRNKQLQASIAETSERQSDAITRRNTTAKVTAAVIVRKAQNKFRNVQSQNKERSQGSDHVYGGEDEESTEQYGQTAAPETASRERRLRRRKREPMFSVEGTDDEQGDAPGNKSLRLSSAKTGEVKAETSAASAGKWEGLANWARAGSRSYMRYSSGSNRLIARATVLLEALKASACLENDVKFDVHFTLQPYNQGDYVGTLPSLEKPHLCCPANVTVQHMLKFLVNRLPYAPIGELELVVVNSDGQSDAKVDGKPAPRQRGKGGSDGAESFKSAEVLHPQATLGQIYTYFWHSHGNLVIMYRLKN